MRYQKLFYLFTLFIAGLLGICLFAVESSALQRQLHAQEEIPKATPASGIVASVEAVQVSPHLAAALADGGEASILVVLRDQADVASLQAAAASASHAVTTSAEARRTARITLVYQELTAHARQSQADLRGWLEAQGIPYRAHYLVNMISVNGDAALVELLRQRPDVARLDANPQVDVMHGVMHSGNFAGINRARWARLFQEPEGSVSTSTTYGVEATRAPEVWALGYTGQGITVASQDTGVQWDHPALQPHYRGTFGELTVHTYSWLDAIPDTGVADGCADLGQPCDDNGHGTHTVGTMVGTTTVMTYGVAPGSQWIGCRNMRGGVGTPESYTTCFEFFLAPYPQGGDPFTEGRPDLAPHIINNSWGCPPKEGCNKESLRQVVETVRAAGLMVVASAGNNGSSCSSVVDPIGIYDATFSVGAHDVNGNLASFSSRGPVTADGSGRLKPDLTAPGVNVLSTARFGGTTSLSGTSMASPHVAGAVALLWSAAPWLVGEIGLTEQLLLKSATPIYSDLCGTADRSISPNPAFGYGRLDVAAAVEMAMQPWELTIAVRDEMGEAVGDAEVVWIDARTGYTHTQTTDVRGSVFISPTLVGTYTLQIRTEAGTLEVDPVALAIETQDETPDETPRTRRIDVLYDESVIAFPTRHYLPRIGTRP